MYNITNVLRIAYRIEVELTAKRPRRQLYKRLIIEIKLEGKDKVSNILLNILEIE